MARHYSTFNISETIQVKYIPLTESDMWPIANDLCDVPRLDVLNTANLCPAISVVGLFYLLTVIMNFVCWFIFRCSFHQKVPVLHVC